MNLKYILMQLGNLLVMEHGWEPNAQRQPGQLKRLKTTEPIVAFTEFVNKHPIVQDVLRSLGVQWPMQSGDSPRIIEAPLERSEISRLFPDGQLSVVIKVPLGKLICSSSDNSYDGMNDLADEEILGWGSGGSLMDLSFKPVGVEGENVLVQVDADCSDLLEDLEDAEEEQRRDEKRGLYPQHDDPAN